MDKNARENENSERKTLLVGLSGGIDSYVAAYLLKIQKQELFALTILFTPDDWSHDGDKLLNCHVSESRLNEIRNFCEHLQIPLTVLRPKDEFLEKVREKWIAQKIQGSFTSHCLDCHELRMMILYNFMITQKCKGLVTGHYAKIFKNQEQKTVSIHSSNDLLNDQSVLLNKLPQNILYSLELPLSELQKKEVDKIGENFQLKNISRPTKFLECLPKTESLDKWIKTTIPSPFLGEGEVLNPQKHVLTKHPGLYLNKAGDIWKKAINPQEQDLYHLYSDWNTKAWVVGPENHFTTKSFFIERCEWSNNLDKSVPIKAFFTRGEKSIEANLFSKNLGTCWVELVDSEIKIIKGEPVAFYKKKGKNSKILLTGIVSHYESDWGEGRICVNPNDGGDRIYVERDKVF